MPHTITDIILEWSRSYVTPDIMDIDIDNATIEEMDQVFEKGEKHYPSEYKRIESQIDYLNSKLYKDYEVTVYPPHLEFEYRLRNWLKNTRNIDSQKILFKLVPRLFFIGEREYLSLHQTVFNGPIARWLIDQESIDITLTTAQERIQSSLSGTWICGLTDSMLISQFYHVNEIEGSDLRPDLRAFKKLSENNGNDDIMKSIIVDFLRNQVPQFKRIVLLEDFVGTGTQVVSTVKWALTLNEIDPIPVLFCPLVICRSGVEKFQKLLAEYSNFSFEPSLILDDSVLLTKFPKSNEDEFFTQLRDVVHQTYDLVKGNNSGKLYGPFGFGSKEEGGGLLLVLYSNCPNNTIPLIHNESDTPWNPLFPRSSRV